MRTYNLRSIVICRPRASDIVDVVAEIVVLEGIDHIEVDDTSSALSGVDASSFRARAPGPSFSLAWELVRGMFRTCCVCETSYGIVHVCCCELQVVEGDVVLHPEFGKCMPVGQLKEHVCDSVVVVRREQTFDHRHDDLETVLEGYKSVEHSNCTYL